MQIDPGKYPIQTFKKNNKVFVKCIIRNRSIELTPEEFIRQVIIAYVIHEKSISKSKIAIEKGFEINGRYKRFDAVIYNSLGAPWVLIECKQSEIKIDETVFLQASNYNKVLKAPYLWLSNGPVNQLFEIKDNKYEEVADFNVN